MKKDLHLIFPLLTLSLACSLFSAPPTKAATETQILLPAVTETNIPETAPLPSSALVNVYDPARDPAQDLRQAISIAQREHKNIMLELGGDWCIWCKYMDDFYATHADILQVRAENYVLVKVNVSSENDNAAFLARFPGVAGYPHIFILDSSGNLIHSQNTAELEDGKISYVPAVFLAFLKEWAP